MELQTARRGSTSIIRRCCLNGNNTNFDIDVNLLFGVILANSNDFHSREQTGARSPFDSA